jgi:hypothetical protein
MEEDYGKKYYQEHKELMDSRSKEWKIKNKEAWNAYQRDYKRIRYQSQKKPKNKPNDNDGNQVNTD